MRLLVTDTAAQSPRQSTAWLIMTLGRNTIHMKRHIRSVFIATALLPVFLILLQTVTRGGVAVITTEFSARLGFALVVIGGIGAFITQRMMTQKEAYPFERKNKYTENEN